MHDQRQNTKETIDALLNDPVLNKDENLVDGLTALKNTLDSREYRITVLGEFSSGKSTFLNALIGMDILPHGVEETTGAVTYLHNVAKNSSLANKIKVLFRDEDIPPVELDLNSSHKALIDFVTVKSSERNVAKDISEVHIYIPYLAGDDNIVLIDTPGLNGIKEGLRDITYREINRSHANICLFGIKGVSQSDLGFIEDFYKSGTPFFFVLNQIDMLKADEETADKKIFEFQENIRESVIHTPEPPANVFGVSALQALASRDTSITRIYKDSRELTPGDREKLSVSSRIASFEEALYRFVKDGEIERNFIGQVQSRIRVLLATVAERAKEEADILRASTSDIPEKNILEDQIDRVEKRFVENKKIIKNKLSGKMADLEKEAVKQVGTICDAVADSALRKVSEWDTLDKAEKATKNKEIVNLINNEIAKKRELFPGWLSPRLDAIYREMIDVVRSFVPSISLKNKKADWQFSSTREDMVDESKIERIKRSMDSIRLDIRQQQEKKDEVERMKNELSRRIQSNNDALWRDQRKETTEKRELGNRPEYRTWTETRKVKKRFLFFSWNSKKEYLVDNKDEIDNYDRKHSEIERRHSSSQNAIRSTISSLEQQKRGLSTVPIDATIKRLEAQLAQLDSQKRRELEDIEFQKRAARSKYLAKLKAYARDLVDKALSTGSGQLFLALKDDVRQNIFDTESRMISDLDRIYSDLISAFKKSVRILIDKIENKADIVSQKRRITDLDKFISHANRFLS